MLGPSLSGRKQGIAGYAIDPRRESALPLEGGQVRYDAEQDFLRGVLGIFRVPEHAESQIVDAILYGSEELIQGLPIAVYGALQQIFGHRQRSFLDTTPFGLELDEACDWKSIAPSVAVSAP
jgi:hypothetical protein